MNGIKGSTPGALDILHDAFKKVVDPADTLPLEAAFVIVENTLDRLGEIATHLDRIAIAQERLAKAAEAEAKWKRQ